MVSSVYKWISWDLIIFSYCHWFWMTFKWFLMSFIRLHTSWETLYDVQRFFINFQWFPILPDWLLTVFNKYFWFSCNFEWFARFLKGLHWFSMAFNCFPWFPLFFNDFAVELIFGEVGSLGGVGVWCTHMPYRFIMRRDEVTCGLCSDAAQCLT